MQALQEIASILHRKKRDTFDAFKVTSTIAIILFRLNHHKAGEMYFKIHKTPKPEASLSHFSSILLSEVDQAFPRIASKEVLPRTAFPHYSIHIKIKIKSAFSRWEGGRALID